MCGLSRDAGTGRSIGRAPQGRLPGGTWERSTTGAGPRTGLRGPGRLTRYVIWTTGLAVPGPEDSEQLEPAGQAERGDSILQRRHANVHLRVWGLEQTRR